jgi:hypothetical protein
MAGRKAHAINDDSLARVKPPSGRFVLPTIWANVSLACEHLRGQPMLRMPATLFAGRKIIPAG